MAHFIDCVGKVGRGISQRAIEIEQHCAWDGE
jgi:hypothetical protein